MKANIKSLSAAAKARMKNLFRNSRPEKSLVRNQRGQGMTEYALLLLVIVAMVAVFRDKIKTAVGDKLGSVADSITGFSSGE